MLSHIRGKNKVRYITQIGTGNYNEKNSKALYTDLSLMTADRNIGIEAATVFLSYVWESLFMIPNIYWSLLEV